MRFLGVTETCDLGALYLSLRAEGHEVRVAISEPLAQGTLRGLVDRTPDWRAELDWVREAGDDGIILFESVSEGFGDLQDRLRREGFNVVGGSAFRDKLENDRAFAQGLLAELGFPRGHIWRFGKVGDALDFIAERPARYVVKRSGAGHSAGDTYLGQLPDGADVAAMLRARGDAPGETVLMAFIEGVEMGVGAYFNGSEFIRPACLDWEHKRFFAGDLGEMTGEMGTVVTYARTESFFERTLAKLAPCLRAHRHVGYVNLNTIVNADGVWPLEFTCRFGYPGYAILSPLQQTPWSRLLAGMTRGDLPRFEAEDGFCLGVVLSTPPFPYSRHEVDEAVGLPVLIGPDLDRRHFHLGEAGLDDQGALVTSGVYGWTAVVTGTGPSIDAAKTAAYANVEGVFTPRGRYRLDIGDRLLGGDFDQVVQLGCLDPANSPQPLLETL